MSWIDDNKGQTPWSVEIDNEKLSYNDGSVISTSDNPIWSMDHSGVAISNTHKPCGYWIGNPYVPNPLPPVFTFTGIYACTFSAMYQQIIGEEDFTTIQYGGTYWTGMCAAPNGNTYVCGAGRDIWMRTNGVGDFVALNQTYRNWSDMCATPDGDIYACVLGGRVYKQISGIGDFEDIGVVSDAYHGISSDINGNIYICYINGKIYKLSGATRTIYAEDLGNCYAMYITPTNDLYYGNTSKNKIYKQTNLTGDFVEQTVDDGWSKTWTGICADPDGNVYACSSSNPRIYKQTGGVGTFETIDDTIGPIWYGICGYL